MDKVELKGISSGANIYKTKNGHNVIYGEYHFVSPNETVRIIEEDLTSAKKIIEKGEVKMSDGRIAEKYILYFEEGELNEIEEGFVQIILLDKMTFFGSKSVNLETLFEFENTNS